MLQNVLLAAPDLPPLRPGRLCVWLKQLTVLLALTSLAPRVPLVKQAPTLRQELQHAPVAFMDRTLPQLARPLVFSALLVSSALYLPRFRPMTAGNAARAFSVWPGQLSAPSPPRALSFQMPAVATTPCAVWATTTPSPVKPRV